MPGFFINGSEGNSSMPSSNNEEDWLRSHRFRLRNFFGQMVDRNNQAEFMALKDVTLPDKKVSELSIAMPGTTYKFAKQAGYTDLKMSFYGSKTLLAKCFQLADKVHDTKDGIKDYNDYKGEVVFQLYDFSLSFNVLGLSIDFTGISAIEYSYKNAWISEVKHSQVSYASSEIMMISTNIKFDFFEVTLIQRGSKPITSNSQDTLDILGANYNGEASR